MAKYKIIVPKAGANDKFGTEVKLYELDEFKGVDAQEDWQEAIDEHIRQQWLAMEVKLDEPSDEGEPVRARNDKGINSHGDDPSTPDVNEAWEGGKAPAKKSSKKKTTKKTTKKSSK